MLELVARLAATDPWECSPDQRLDVVAGWERVKAWVEAQQAVALAAAAHTGPDPLGDDDWVREDVACALTLSPAAAHHRIETARALDGPFLATRDLLAAGLVSGMHARALVEETRDLADDARRAVQKAVLDDAPTLTPGSFRHRVRQAVIAADPAGAAERRAAAQRRRAVRWWAEPDGMATLQATMPAEAVQTVWAGLSTVADGWDDQRSLDERRADALLLLVTGRADTPATQVNVTVDLPTLLGLADNPAELAGYGPIPPALARALADDAAWSRWVTEPPSGQLLDQGRTRYRPTAALRRFIRARDARCRFPGCPRPATRTDLDHRISWGQGGPTDADNLASLCRRHHRLKTHTRWHYERRPDGTAEWTTPTGRTYRDPPPRPG